jgi:hypothetical protein
VFLGTGCQKRVKTNGKWSVYFSFSSEPRKEGEGEGGMGALKRVVSPSPLFLCTLCARSAFPFSESHARIRRVFLALTSFFLIVVACLHV